MSTQSMSAPRLQSPLQQGEKLQLAFEALHVPIGERVKLEVRSPRLKATVVYLGHLRDRAILLSMPQRVAPLPSSAEGSTVTVRMIVADRACAFTSRIQKIQIQPFPTLYLDYPASVEAVVVRHASRVPVRLLVSADEVREGELGGGWPRQALCTDISLRGACIEAGDLLGELNDEIYLTLRVPVADVDQLLLMRCRIRNVEDLDDVLNGEYRVVHGVEFIEADEDSRLALSGFVYQQMLKQAGLL